MHKLEELIAQGDGYNIILAIYQMLKLSGMVDPTRENPMIEQALDVTRELSQSTNDPSAIEEMKSWIMSLLDHLSPEAIGVLSDPEQVHKLSREALTVTPEQHAARKQRDREQAERNRVGAEAFSQTTQRQLVMQFDIELDKLKERVESGQILSSEQSALLDNLLDLYFDNKIKPEDITTLSRAFQPITNTETQPPAPLASPHSADIEPPPLNAPIAPEISQMRLHEKHEKHPHPHGHGWYRRRKLK